MRGEHARPGQQAAVDVVAHDRIDGGAHALHGGETSLQRRPRIPAVASAAWSGDSPPN